MKQLKKRINPWKAGSIFTILALTFYVFSCQTQNLTDVTDHVESQLEDETFQIVENPASFDGGIEEFFKYVGDNLKYPQQALDNGVSGRIFIEFVVEKDGSISNTKILRGIGYGCDEEAIRVLENSPPWTPGQQKGHIVRQRMVLPITFKHPDSPPIEETPIDQFNAQNIRFIIPPKPGNSTTEIEEIPTDQFPSFPKGNLYFYKYVQENLQYPEEAKKAGISGSVFVQFMVNTDGSIYEAKVVKGIGYGCDKEALRIINESPKWNPAKVESLEKVSLVIPIKFDPEK